MDSRRFERLPAHELDQSEALAYREFRERCAASGLLERPVGLRESDVPDGVNDDVTILYAPTFVRPFGPVSDTTLASLPGASCGPISMTLRKHTSVTAWPVRCVTRFSCCKLTRILR